MNSINSAAVSALQAFSTSQSVTAHNIANLNTDNFKASNTQFQENGAGGVSLTLSGSQDSVDISREAVNLLQNQQGFKANIKVFKAADDMTKELLGITTKG